MNEVGADGEGLIVRGKAPNASVFLVTLYIVKDRRNMLSHYNPLPIVASVTTHVWAVVYQINYPASRLKFVISHRVIVRCFHA